MKICMLTSLHSPKDDRIFYKEAISLKNNGNDVSILCLTDEIGNMKDMSGLLLNTNNEEQLKCDGIKIIAVKKHKGFIQRVLHKFALGETWKDFIKKAKDINANVYHAHEPQTAFIGLKIQKQIEAKLIYDAHEPWIFSRSAKEWILKKICLPNLRNIITANRITLENLKKENTNLHTEVIYNCSPEFFSRERKNNKEVIICHEGSLSFNRGLKLILDTLIILKLGYPNFKFRIIGDVYGKESNYLFKRIKENNLENNIEISGWLCYKDVPKTLGDCSIGIIANTDKERNTLAGPPNKLFNYMTMGLATVAIDLIETNRIIKETHCGIIIEKRDSKLFANKLKRLLEDNDYLITLQKHSIVAATDKYNWKLEEKKLFQFYKSLK